MWGNIILESYTRNLFNTSFPNQKTFILLYLIKWQYFWWFWFSYLFILYYIIFFNKVLKQSIRFNSKITTTKKSHGKWGDLIICFLPIFWCLNILTNSNSLLKAIEWQTESNSILVRVRGKQWFWIYKLSVDEVIKLFNLNITIGSNKYSNLSKTNFNTVNLITDSTVNSKQNFLKKNIHFNYIKTNITEDSTMNFLLYKNFLKNRKLPFFRLSTQLRTNESDFFLKNSIKTKNNNYDAKDSFTDYKYYGLSSNLIFSSLNKIKEINKLSNIGFFTPKNIYKIKDYSTDLILNKKDSFSFVKDNKTNGSFTAFFNKDLIRFKRNFTNLINKNYYYINNRLPIYRYNTSSSFKNTKSNIIDIFLKKPTQVSRPDRNSIFTFKKVDFGNYTLVLEKNPLNTKPILSFIESNQSKETFKRVYMSIHQNSRKDSYDHFKVISKKPGSLQKEPIKSNYFLNNKNIYSEYITYGNNKNIIENYNNNKNFLSNNKFMVKNRNKINYNIYSNQRLLDVDNLLVLPTETNITVITNSFDVVHSWFIPGLGLKMDCVPGRSTHHSLYVRSPGFYYGQCAEICGRLHHHMPIKICFLPIEHFLVWWNHFSVRFSKNPSRFYNY